MCVCVCVCVCVCACVRVHMVHIDIVHPSGRVLFGGYDDYAIRVWDVIKVYTCYIVCPSV